METLVPAKVLSLGLSNVDLQSLQIIYERSKIKPQCVQNRFTGDIAPRLDTTLPPGLPYPQSPYDKTVRRFCDDNFITYTMWGLLWGNPALFDEPDPNLDSLSQDIGVSKHVLLYALLRSLGYGILCGTTRAEKMDEIVKGLAKVTLFVQFDENRQRWNSCVAHIRSIIS